MNQNPKSHCTNCQAGTCQGMNADQEAHLARIKAQFLRDVDEKYRKGAAEHQNNLLDNDAVAICRMMIEEAIDQYAYATSLLEKLTTPKPSECTDSELPPEVVKAYVAPIAEEIESDLSRCQQIIDEMAVEDFALETWRELSMRIGDTVMVRIPANPTRDYRITNDTFRPVTITPELLARHAK